MDTSLPPQTFLLPGPSINETLIRTVETVNISLRQFLLTALGLDMFNMTSLCKWHLGSPDGGRGHKKNVLTVPQFRLKHQRGAALARAFAVFGGETDNEWYSPFGSRT